MNRVIFLVFVIIFFISCSSNNVVLRYVEYAAQPGTQIYEEKYSKELINVIVKHFNFFQEGCKLTDSYGNQYQCHKFPDDPSFIEELFLGLNNNSGDIVRVYFASDHGSDTGNYLDVSSIKDMIVIYQVFNFTVHEAAIYKISDSYVLFFKNKDDFSENFTDLYQDSKIKEKHKWRYILF